MNVDRAMAARDIQMIIQQADINVPVFCYSSVKLAKESAIKSASTQDRVLVFGSFHVVSEILQKSPQASV